MFKRLTGMAILLICLLPVHSVFAGVVEEINKAREAYQTAMTSAATPAEQQTALSTYRETCLAAINAHGDTPYSKSEVETVAGALVDIEEAPRALDLLSPFLENEPSQGLLGLAATASFAVGKESAGFAYLDRLNREMGQYVQICAMEAILSYQQNRFERSRIFIDRALQVAAFSGQQRTMLLLVYAQMAQDLEIIQDVRNLIRVESRRPGISPQGQMEVKRARRLLGLVGKPVPQVEGVHKWLGTEDWKPGGTSGSRSVLIFFHQDMMDTPDFKQFIDYVKKVKAPDLQLIGITIIKEPVELQRAKGVESPVVSEAEIQAIQEKAAGLKLDFPVGILQSGASWLKFNVRPVPQLVVVGSDHTVQKVAWPPLNEDKLAKLLSGADDGKVQGTAAN